MGRVRPFALCCLLLLCGSATVPVCAQSGFAVQVAAVQSRAEAEALANGFRARGLSAYWVKADVPGKGTYYRVRLGGQFASNRNATDFGQKLKAAGLVNVYAVFKYDAPTNALEEQATDRTVTRSGGPPPVVERAVAKPGSVTVQAEKTAGTTAQMPRTDYLISGRPIPASELETTREGSQPGPATSQPTDPRLNAPPNRSGAGSPTAKPGTTPAKNRDEIELDDFVEFTKVLRGSVETQAGRMQVTLQNINKRHRFRGKVNLTFAENGQETKQPPMQIEIAPGQEQSFDVTPAVGRGGNYMLTVYDEQGALQLMQSGALDAQASRNVVATNRPPQPSAPTNQAGDVPPLEVTEDAPPHQPSGIKSANYPNGNVEDEPGKDKPEPPQAGDVKIIARKVSETSENITLEFEILAQQPLGMITLALRTTSVNEAKQAIMTTKQGRLPFLVPIGDTTFAFSYELKNEQGQLLAAGQMSFQQLKRVE